MNYNAYKPKSKSVLSQQIEQETVLHNPKTGKVYMLNPTAGVIWSLCDGNHTVEQITAELKKRFRQPKGDVSKDVIQTIEELKKQDLLE